MKTIKERAIKWYKDRKLIIAFVIIVTSFVLGAYSKAIVIIKFYEPIYVITGLSLYTFSWILLFAGVFMVGWSTVKRMHQDIHNNVKSAAKKTYHKAKRIPGHATRITKHLHRKGMEKITGTSKAIVESIKKQND